MIISKFVLTMSKKQACPITQFLEKHDREFHQALCGLGQLNLFKVRGSGVTFLYPQDEKFRRKIVHTSYSDNPDKAIDMIKSLVLLDYLPNLDEFDRKKDDIPNSLKNRLDITSVGNKTITLNSGHQLEIDPRFQAFKTKDPVCIWRLTGAGELPLTGSQSTMKYNQNKPGVQNNKLRITKINEIEREYATGRADNIYKQYLTSLYKRVLINEQYIPKVYSGMCALPRAEFYTLFSPHSENNYLPHDLFLETFNHIEYKHIDYIQARNELIRKARGTDPVFTDATNTCKNQKKILDTVSNPMEIRSHLKKSYKGKYGETGDKFLAKDLFTVYCGLSVFEETSDHTYFQRCFMYLVKNVYDNQLTIVNQKASDLAFNYSIYVNLLRSDAFLYTPLLLGHENLDCFTGKDIYPLVDHSPDPTKHTLFSINVPTPVIIPITRTESEE